MTPARHPNLEDAFAPSGRGAGLEGLLKPRRSTPMAPPSRGEPVDTTADSATAATVASPDRPNRAGETEEAPTASGQALNVAAYLPPATLAAAQSEKQVTGEQYADLLARAFDGVDENELRATFAPKRTGNGGGGMPRRVARVRGAAGIQRQFRLTAEQRDWLDKQVRIYQAPSRSAFIAAVLGLHFRTLAHQ